MRDRQTCIGCGKKSPETETNYTLISAQFGWRLTRYRSNDGAIVIEWRCPTCWREYKKARGEPVSSGAASSATTPAAKDTRPPSPSAPAFVASRPDSSAPQTPRPPTDNKRR